MTKKLARLGYKVFALLSDAHAHETRHVSKAMVRELEAKRPKEAYQVKNSLLLSILTGFGEGFTDRVFLVLRKRAQ